MPSSVQSFGVHMILCLALAGCGSAMGLLTDTAHKESKSHALDPDQPQGPKKSVKTKSSRIDAKRMEEWEFELPKAQVGDYTSPVENTEEWTQLWTRWQPDKLVPDVNFDSSQVCLTFGDAGERPLVNILLPPDQVTDLLDVPAELIAEAYRLRCRWRAGATHRRIKICQKGGSRAINRAGPLAATRSEK